MERDFLDEVKRPDPGDVAQIQLDVTYEDPRRIPGEDAAFMEPPPQFQKRNANPDAKRQYRRVNFE